MKGRVPRTILAMGWLLMDPGSLFATEEPACALCMDGPEMIGHAKRNDVSPITKIPDAGDFRGFDLGSSCAPVREREEVQGSVQIPWKKLDGGDLHAFRGRAFDRELSIVYFCMDGHLYSGNYFFPNESLDEAVASFRAVYESLVSTYGTPFIDNSPWQYGQQTKDPRSIASDPRRYYVSWRAWGIWATASLMPDRDDAGDDRHVFVVITRDKR